MSTTISHGTYREARHVNGPVHISRGIRLCSYRRKGNYLIPDNVARILYNRDIDSTWKLSVGPISLLVSVTELPLT